MDVHEVLEWIDELVLTKTGSHLNSLQQAVLSGVWNSQKYREIADNYHCTEANVKRVAGSLWQLISEELDEKVNKSNFRATMERYYIYNSNVGDLHRVNFGEVTSISVEKIGILTKLYKTDRALQTPPATNLKNATI